MAELRTQHQRDTVSTLIGGGGSGESDNPERDRHTHSER